MDYVLFFAMLIPFQLLLVSFVLRLVRARTYGEQTGSWLRLIGNVFLLMVIVNIIALVPAIGIVSVVVWLVGMKRLSGLDILSTFILSFVLGIIVYGAMIILAKYMIVPLFGGPIGS